MRAAPCALEESAPPTGPQRTTEAAVALRVTQVTAISPPPPAVSARLSCSGASGAAASQQGCVQTGKITLQKVKDAAAAQRQQAELQAKEQQFVIEMQQQQQVDQAKMLELQAKAMNEAANAETEKAYAQVAMVNAEIGRMKILYEHRQKMIDHLLEAARIQSDHHIGIKGLETGQREAA